jgi:hypothetical protein
MQINLQEKKPVEWRDNCMVRAGAALFLSGLTGGGNLEGRISDAKDASTGWRWRGKGEGKEMDRTRACVMQ